MSEAELSYGTNALIRDDITLVRAPRAQLGLRREIFLLPKLA